MKHKFFLTAVVMVALLMAVSTGASGVSTVEVRGVVFDEETGLRLGNYRHVPDIYEGTCEGSYKVFDTDGNLIEQGPAVKIVRWSRLIRGQEVTITVRGTGGTVLAAETKSGPPEEGYLEGDFELTLPAGSYWATFYKEGYETKTVALIIPWEGSDLEVRLQPEVSYKKLP